MLLKQKTLVNQLMHLKNHKFSCKQVKLRTRVLKKCSVVISLFIVLSIYLTFGNFTKISTMALPLCWHFDWRRKTQFWENKRSLLICFHLIVSLIKTENWSFIWLRWSLCTYQCKPRGGGGGVRQGMGIWQILKFFDQIPQGGKRKVNQKCQKSPHPRRKKLNKQYYNTV